jgi:PAS domain S-box-containing protein
MHGSIRTSFGLGHDLAELCAESVIVFDAAGIIRRWNASASALYGVLPETALGRSVDSLAAPGYRPHDTAYEVLLSTGRWSGRLRRITSGLTERNVHVRWTQVLNASGESEGTIEFSSAVSDDEEYARFAAGEERYRQLFLRAPVALMLADARGIGRLVRELRAAGITDVEAYVEGNPAYLDEALDIVAVAEVNEQARALFGAAQATDLVGPVRGLWADSPDTFKRALIARLRGVSFFAEETRMRTLDGRTVDILFSLAFPSADTFMGAALMGMLDITDRRRAETQLQKLQADFAHGARISMLGELTASVAHELTQPLGAIAANGQAALRWLDKPVPNLSRTGERIERIVADAHRAGQIIQRIRAMAVNAEPETKPVNLSELVEEVLLFLRHELSDKSVMVSTEFDRALPEISADRIQIQQVVVNLVINSIQAVTVARERGRTIHLRTYVDQAGMVMFSVRDNGPGVEAEHLNLVFTGFFTTKSDGMGMGLTICQSIIAAHGGQIGVENMRDDGACFHFVLPTSPAGREAPST